MRHRMRLTLLIDRMLITDNMYATADKMINAKHQRVLAWFGL